MIGACVGAHPVGARIAWALTEEIPPVPDPVEGGTATFTRTGKKVTIEWVADEDGEVDTASTFTLDGKVQAVVFIPSDETAPTAGYDVWLFDADRHDVLLGQGVNRSATDPQRLGRAVTGAIANSTVTLAVRNAGDGGAGTVSVWVR